MVSPKCWKGERGGRRRRSNFGGGLGEKSFERFERMGEKGEEEEEEEVTNQVWDAGGESPLSEEWGRGALKIDQVQFIRADKVVDGCSVVR